MYGVSNKLLFGKVYQFIDFFVRNDTFKTFMHMEYNSLLTQQ